MTSDFARSDYTKNGRAGGKDNEEWVIGTVTLIEKVLLCW
jgi:hypothetical protein